MSRWLASSVRTVSQHWLATSGQSIPDPWVHEYFSIHSKIPEEAKSPKVALKQALDAVFQQDQLWVLSEVPFCIGTADNNKNQTKRLDFVLCPKTMQSPLPVVAIELKTTMEFNPLAAALMEFALLTDTDTSIFLPFSTANARYLKSSNCKIKCLTVSYFDNQDASPLLTIMQNRLWQGGQRKVHHYCLFFPSPQSSKEAIQIQYRYAEDIIRALAKEVREWFES